MARVVTVAPCACFLLPHFGLAFRSGRRDPAVADSWRAHSFR